MAGAIGVSLALLAGLVTAAPAAPEGMTQRSERLAQGVRYTMIRDARGPFRIRVVTAKLSTVSTFDTVLATDRLPGFETTSSMADRSGALVAINGDYARPSGRPVFTFASDGDIAQTPLLWGRNFAVDQSETLAYIGHPKVTGWATETDTGTVYPVARVNQGAPDVDEIARFTRAGGSEEKPPDETCVARLFPQEGARFASSGTGVEADHLVDRVKCGGRSLRPQGGSILSAPITGDYAPGLGALLPGESMTLGWSLGWPQVADTIGGNPTLVEDGKIIEHNVTGEDAFFKRHPRTGVGTTPDGKVLLVVVDGRQPGYSVGMNLREFARLFVSLGADRALNLDGGGSTTMVIDGEIVNRPSTDGRIERPVSSALVLLPSADVGETEFQPPPPAPKAGPGDLWTRAEVWREIATDPASTGGLLTRAP
jgi:hypothetical protein